MNRHEPISALIGVKVKLVLVNKISRVGFRCRRPKCTRLIQPPQIVHKRRHKSTLDRNRHTWTQALIRVKVKLVLINEISRVGFKCWRPKYSRLFQPPKIVEKRRHKSTLDINRHIWTQALIRLKMKLLRVDKISQVGFRCWRLKYTRNSNPLKIKKSVKLSDM